MSLPSVAEVRSRIESIEDEWYRRFFQTVYLLGLRVGEACGLKYSSEKKANPTGMHLKVKRDIFKPNLLNFDEINDLKAVFTMNMSRVPEEGDIREISEPVAIFTVMTEKRQGFIRTPALPLNPVIEPWAEEIVKHIEERQDNSEPVFPFYRQQLWPVARRIFFGLSYPIIRYKKLLREPDGKAIKDDSGKNLYAQVQDHQKPFGDHALRHLRATELKSYYRIRGEMLDAFMGWAKPRSAESSAMQDRYVLEPWREAGYFPRLLRRRA